jgi:phosphoglycerate dehydrogenase-like enzyme
VSSPVRLQAVLTAPSLPLTPHIAGGTQESLLRRNLTGFPRRRRA